MIRRAVRVQPQLGRPRRAPFALVLLALFAWAGCHPAIASGQSLDANLWVNGEESTGIWHNARGDLTFSLKTVPPNFGRGPYSGTIQLEQEPPK